MAAASDNPLPSELFPLHFQQIFSIHLHLLHEPLHLLLLFLCLYLKFTVGALGSLNILYASFNFFYPQPSSSVPVVIEL